MKELARLTLKIKPEPQKRHRTVTRGKGGRLLPFAHTYDPSADYKNKITYQGVEQWSPKKKETT